MCCFSGAIRNVANTRIFARLTGRGSQFLAYQMEYESDEPNAMILPLPVALPASESSVDFLDLSEYEHFFDDLSDGFPFIPPASIGCSAREDTASRALPDHELVVVEVGNFIASFVPSFGDFSRLDPRFVIPAETWQAIPEYADYGFAVFQLKNLKGKPHPMAFEFQTRTKEVFFPTVHIHDGEVHKVEAFDHSLYLQHAGLDSRVGKYRNRDIRDRLTGFVRSIGPAKSFCDSAKAMNLIQPDLLVHRIDMKGNFANRDMVYSIFGDAEKPGYNWRQSLWFAPYAIIVAAIAWIIARRNRLRSTRTTG